MSHLRQSTDHLVHGPCFSAPRTHGPCFSAPRMDLVSCLAHAWASPLTLRPHRLFSCPPSLMDISKEDELADLFGDIVRIAGSPDAGEFLLHHHTSRSSFAAKSALRAYLHKNRSHIVPPSPSSIPSENNTPKSPQEGYSPLASTISTTISPPAPVVVQRAITSPPEY